MLITKIIDEDIDSCCKVFECDMQLKTIENEFYSLLSKCSEDVEFDMERNVNEYMARVARLAYLQGIIDFSKLFVVLKEDTHEILRKYEKNGTGIGTMFQCSDMAAFWYIEIGIGTDKYSIADIWLDITII